MQIISSNRAFTLIELIIVITIMGLIATFVGTRLSTASNHSIVLTPETLKKYLTAFNSTKRLDLFCYADCTQCDLWEGDKKLRTSLSLESNNALRVRRFDRFGHLAVADPAVRFERNGIKDGCFEFSLYPDGLTSPLILESQGTFIVYSPLGVSRTSRNEDELRTLLYDTTLLNSGSYYGSH